MNYQKIVFEIFWFLALIPAGGRAQTTELNKVSNWIYPAAQKYVGMDFINEPTGTLINNGAVWYTHNFTNNGKVDFATAQAIDPAVSKFSGTATQHLSGTGTTRFYSLFLGSDLVDNAFSLEQNITVAHRIDFIKGIVVASQATPQTMTNMVLMENGADWTNTSDLSYVDGFVSKTGNSAFTFPIGGGGYYRPVSISAPTATTDCFAARYVYGDPNSAGFTRTQRDNLALHVSNKEYWVLNRRAGNSDVQLTLSWDATKTSVSMPSDLRKIRIVRWNGSMWITEGNVSTTGNFTSGTVTANASGYGVFSLATYLVTSVAMNDSVSTLEDHPVSGNVLSNDSVFEGSTLALTGFSVGSISGQPGSVLTISNVGTITMATDGVYTFTPALNYDGAVPVIRYTAIGADRNTVSANLAIVIQPLPEIAKRASKPVANNDGSFTWKYTISLYNDTPAAIDSVQVEDNLDDVFSAKNCTYTLTSLVASGQLVANGSYNGSTVIKTLLAGGTLAVNARDSIQMEVRVNPYGQSDTLVVSNQAFFSGQTLGTNGKTVYFTGIGTDGNAITGAAEPTTTVLPRITVFIPDGFSPNGDGINDKLVITHTASTKIDLEVYNRWGVLVYKSSDYKNDWDGRGMGTFLGKELITGTYYCVYKQIKIATGEVVNKNVKYISLRRQ
jgi:gliding motility-associated-like protein